MYHARKWKFEKTHIVWTFISDLPPIPHNAGWPHTFFLWMELLIKPPFHPIFQYILQILLPKMGFLCKETPHFTNILCHFGLYTHITPTLTNFTPILRPHDSTQFFHFWPPHSTPHSFRACYSPFWLSRPPPRPWPGGTSYILHISCGESRKFWPKTLCSRGIHVICQVAWLCKHRHSTDRKQLFAH